MRFCGVTIKKLDEHTVRMSWETDNGYGDGEQEIWRCTCGFWTYNETTAEEHRDRAERW